jgi:quercetin dioxygenase-like cupin family protein
VSSRPVAVEPDDVPWASTSIDGLEEKVLWSDPDTGASVTLLRWAKGAGIERAHSHPSNQFFYCLSGEYLDAGSGIVSRPGSFYWNPKGVVHGPTEAIEECVLLEIYDGPHYD